MRSSIFSRRVIIRSWYYRINWGLRDQIWKRRGKKNRIWVKLIEEDPERQQRISVLDAYVMEWEVMLRWLSNRIISRIITRNRICYGRNNENLPSAMAWRARCNINWRGSGCFPVPVCVSLCHVSASPRNICGRLPRFSAAELLVNSGWRNRGSFLLNFCLISAYFLFTFAPHHLWITSIVSSLLVLQQLESCGCNWCVGKKNALLYNLRISFILLL